MQNFIYRLLLFVCSARCNGTHSDKHLLKHLKAFVAFFNIEQFYSRRATEKAREDMALIHRIVYTASN